MYELTPAGPPRAVIVYYHGGGWVLGSVDESDLLGRALAERTGCAVVLAGYRLAPEYRYPTAVDDSQAALDWAVAHRDGIAGGPVPVVVAGDSAGGNLAAVVARRARDRGGPEISLQVLVYPVTDCDLSTTSYTDPANQLILSAQSMAWFWDHYAPEHAARTHPDASPMRSIDFIADAIQEHLRWRVASRWRVTGRWPGPRSSPGATGGRWRWGG